MIIHRGKETENVYFSDQNSEIIPIDFAYNKAIMVWELIVGFLFSKGGFSLQSKDGYILKAKNQ